MAYNSLAAITYWCQGKSKCEFKPQWLIENTKASGTKIPNLFYLHDQGYPVKGYLEALQSCQKYGYLATLSSPESLTKAMKIISKSNKSQGFWVHSDTTHYFQELNIQVTGQDSKGCLVVIKDPSKANEIHLQWESCYDVHQESYGALCEAHFGQHYKYNHTCFKDVSTPVLEYRFHLGPKLNRKDVNCPMDVYLRRGDTCYKKTEPMSWIEARAQCWSWGGELAFPLPKSHPECIARTTYRNAEKLWIAGPEDCGEARCPLSFNDAKFVEGTYDESNDICFVETAISQNDEDQFRGLCALPAMHPRTPLPPPDSCPKKYPGSEDWPFPNYSWNVEGNLKNYLGTVWKNKNFSLTWKIFRENNY